MNNPKVLTIKSASQVIPLSLSVSGFTETKIKSGGRESLGKNKIEAFKMVPVDSQAAHKVSVVPSFYPYGVVSMRGALCALRSHPLDEGGRGWGRV